MGLRRKNEAMDHLKSNMMGIRGSSRLRRRGVEDGGIGAGLPSLRASTRTLLTNVSADATATSGRSPPSRRAPMRKRWGGHSTPPRAVPDEGGRGGGGCPRGIPLSVNADSAPPFRPREKGPIPLFFLEKGPIPLFFPRFRRSGFSRFLPIVSNRRRIPPFFGRKVDNSAFFS